ncbi:hypothetical protein X945_5804 [Burkholderia pseudomallei ABCPW 107]|nr:hypothetical protein X945_5804 [Burkholderia pseudomallei ABCPW 107]
MIGAASPPRMNRLDRVRAPHASAPAIRPIGGLACPARGAPAARASRALAARRERRAQPAHALENLRFARRGERQPQAARIRVARVERRARHVHHVVLERALEHLGRVAAAAEARPHEHAARRLAPFDIVRHELRERAHERAATAAVSLRDRAQMRGKPAARQVAADRFLRDRRGAQIARLLRHGHPAQNRGGRDRPADPQARRDDFRQAAEIDGPVRCAVMREHGLHGLAGETQVRVRIVLDEHEPRVGRDRREPRAARRRQRRAGRIRERRHRIQQLRTALGRGPRGKLRGERVGVDAVGIGAHRHELRAREPQRLQRGRIRGRLDERDVARLDQRAHEQIEALLRARRDEHLRSVARDAARARHPVGERGAQAGLAGGVAILQAGHRIVAGRVGERRRDALAVEQLGGRIAARERDHPRLADVLEQLADRRALRIGERRGERIIDGGGERHGGSGAMEVGQQANRGRCESGRGRHLEDAGRIARVEAQVERAAAGLRVGHRVARDEFVERARHLAFDERARRVDERARDRIRAERGLPHAARARHLDGRLDRPAERALRGGERIDIGHPVGRVVERIAFGRDPRHLRRFGEQRVVVGERRRRVLAAEAAHEHGQERARVGKRQRRVALELRERRDGLRRQRVGRRAEHVRHGRLERGAEALRMKLAHEELRDLVRRVEMRVRAARHFQALERIGAVQPIAERPQDPRERGLARRQRAARRPAHGAQRAVIERHAAAVARDVARIGAARRHPFEQIREQRHVQRLRKLGARDDAGLAALETRRDMHEPHQFVDGRLIGNGGEQGGEIRVHRFFRGFSSFRPRARRASARTLTGPEWILGARNSPGN